MTQGLSHAAGFNDPDFADWQALAEKALKGAPLEKLTAKTLDGLAVKPLYTRADARSDMGEPGAAPFVRGALASRDPFLPWDMRQTVLDPDPHEANRVALEDLERGVSSLEFVIDPTGACGVQAVRAGDYAQLLRGILTDLACVAISAPHDPLGAAQALGGAIGEGARGSARLAFNIDPMAARMTGHAGCDPVAAAGFAKEAAQAFPSATALRADARPVHEGGGSDAQELAVLIASGIAHLKAGEAVGLNVAEVNATVLFTLATSCDVTLEMAKLRAARRLWARVLDACGVQAPMQVQAVTSARMQTQRDPWTNILRATCAGFAAAAGGADVITVLPFTSALGLADAQARRIARNTQIILQEESHLGRVTDPAGGAWAVEALADDLAHAAWPLVQTIAQAGGLEAALREGIIQAWVAETRAKRCRDIATRKTPLIGISMYANLDEARPQVKAGLAEASANLPVAAGSGAIAPMRLSAAYEALRDRADALTQSATVFLATLGPLAKFSGRAGFARNAFEAGGMRALGAGTAYGDDAALVQAFQASGAHIVCLCGDDAAYGERADTAAAALRAAGAACIWLAGKHQGPDIDRTFAMGSDILAELTHALGLLETLS